MRKTLILALLLSLVGIGTFAQTPSGAYTSPAVSSGGASSPSDNTILVTQAPYNAKFDVKVIYDVNYLITSSVINAPNETPFTAADVGKIAFGSTYPQSASASCSGSACGQVLVPQGTITTFTSSSSVSVSTTSTAACTPAAFPQPICAFAYGTQDDTSAINAAASAAWNTPGVCKTLRFPSGYAFFSATILSVGVPNSTFASPCGFQTSGQIGNSDPAPQGGVAAGTGPGTSVFIPLPTFTFPCTGGTSGVACVGGSPVVQYHDFGVNGLGQTMAGLTRNVNLFEVSTITPACTGGTAWNLGLSQWGGTSVGSSGFFTNPGCANPTFWNINVIGFGAQTCVINSALDSTYTGLVCDQSGPANNCALLLNGPGITNTFASAFGDSYSTGFSVCFGANSQTWNSFGDYIVAASCASTFGGLNNILNQSAGNIVVNLEGDSVLDCATATTSSFLINLQGSGTMKLHIKNSTLNASGTHNTLFFSSANNNIYDDGGNIITAGSGVSTLSGQFVADGHSVKGICTGVATASSTIGLRISGSSTTGTAVVTACTNSAVLDAGVPVEGARTLYLLKVTATAAGTNASSGVVTVLKNGSATAMTCTIGTGTACVDDQHQIAVADGDLISIQFTTQAADTLAGVKALAVYN